MNKISQALSFLLLFNMVFATSTAFANKVENSLVAHKANSIIRLDGIADDISWASATWQPLNHLILGEMPTKEDFSGQFKVLWDEQQLYLLVEITDDILFDQHADPLHFYWDDDCLEIFIDEDASGGDHQFNFNAFAYHVALDNQAVDIGPNNPDGSTNFVLLNDHIDSVWRRSSNKDHKLVWELAIRIFDDSFDLNKTRQQAVTLWADKIIGFMLAYCDNDGSKEREHFIGSTNILAVNGDKNLGYKTANVFQKLKLVP